MPQKPLDYATPQPGERPPLTFAEKWTRIILVLTAATVVLFVLLFYLHMMSISSNWSP